ncbi:MAG: hypothetical protein M1498_01365 [Candidatus Thermoplasmatota archaeon]|nr:hypothetical protein [Candidatus Thermoplasmatota archaeon]MCL5888340.1 hypothetical protein [Candidatus Thermoplasmatota archaeon]
MHCLILNKGRIEGLEDMDDLAKVPYDEAFVVDIDAITHYHFNFKLYNELSKYIEFTLMAYPYKENDLMDIIISGASRVVINDTLDVGTISKFLDVTDELVLHCSDGDKAHMFHNLTGNMYLSCRIFQVPGVFFYYGSSINSGPNIIPLENFPEELKVDC